MQAHETRFVPREQWLAVKARLRETYAALSEEVRAYPSPIARCDDQLPKLIERRTAVHGRILRAEAQPDTGLPDATYLALASEYEDFLSQIAS